MKRCLRLKTLRHVIRLQKCSWQRLINNTKVFVFEWFLRTNKTTNFRSSLFILNKYFIIFVLNLKWSLQSVRKSVAFSYLRTRREYNKISNIPRNDFKLTMLHSFFAACRWSSTKWWRERGSFTGWPEISVWLYRRSSTVNRGPTWNKWPVWKRVLWKPPKMGTSRTWKRLIYWKRWWKGHGIKTQSCAQI